MKLKFSIVFILFTVLTASVIIISSVREIQQAATIMVSHSGMPILNRAAAAINGDQYERLTNTLDDTDDFFIETQRVFRELKNEAQCLYLYTMARYGDGTHRFIFDGEEPGTENYSHIGMVEDVSDYDKTYMLTYETGMPQFTSMMHQLQWGRLISAYMPILNSAGDVVGIIGVDFQGEDVYRAIIANLWRQIAFAFIFTLIGLFIYFSFLKDLTRQNERLAAVAQKRERELLADNEILDRLNRMKNEFFQNMSHNLKTPLTVISTDIANVTSQFKYEIDEEDCLESLGNAQAEIMRMARMIDGAMKHAAMQETQHDMEPLDMAALLRDGAETYRALLERHGNALTLAVPDKLPRILGNADTLLHVLSNLLSNANRYTRNGEISIRAETENHTVSVTVQDNGEGVKPELLPDIWERGVSDGGTGLGLPICKSAIEDHNGEITIKSEPGRGTAITFTLPIIGEETDYE